MRIRGRFREILISFFIGTKCKYVQSRIQCEIYLISRLNSRFFFCLIFIELIVSFLGQRNIVCKKGQHIALQFSLLCLQFLVISW